MTGPERHHETVSVVEAQRLARVSLERSLERRARSGDPGWPWWSALVVGVVLAAALVVGVMLGQA